MEISRHYTLSHAIAYVIMNSMENLTKDFDALTQDYFHVVVLYKLFNKGK